MTTKRTSQRRTVGTTILNGAQLVDTTLIADRLQTFVTAHTALLEAEDAVVAAQSAVDTAVEDVDNIAGHLHEAVDGLERLLIADGGERRNPLVTYGAPSSYAISRQKPVDAVATVRSVVKAILNDRKRSDAVRAAAEAAERAAQSVADGLPGIEERSAKLREARQRRDTLATRWDEAVTHLRHGARYAEGAGVPGIYATLFGSIRPRSAKKAKRTATPNPDPNAAAA